MLWRKGTFFREDQVYFGAALLAAHASYEHRGIRQRDLKFFFELFRAWTTELFHKEVSQPCNMQVARALRTMVTAGFAKVSRKNKIPHYRLTQAGVIGALRILVSPTSPTNIEECVFVLYFISNYQAKISKLVSENIGVYPPATIAEIKSLLDLKAVQDEFLKSLDQRIALFEKQIKDNIQASTRARELRASGAQAQEIASMLQLNFPYHLNAQRPLQELYPDLPPDIALWEITEGPQARANMLWKPLLLTLQSYRQLLTQS